jgi:hypothetical protein
MIAMATLVPDFVQPLGHGDGFVPTPVAFVLATTTTPDPVPPAPQRMRLHFPINDQSLL